MLILGIESSCDETSAAVVKDGRTVISNVIYSQIPLHRKYGGVVPEIASRKHVEHIDSVIGQALLEANARRDDIDAIAVTYGPGLVGALLVGLNFAKALAFSWRKPFVGVHHIEGHIYANFINSGLEPPFVCLIVSGGHTQLVVVEDYGRYRAIGGTKDDSAGEAFDKVARAIGLSYPGGVLIDELSRSGNAEAVNFPRALINSGDYDFSFSGLKSAVLNYLSKAKALNRDIIREDVAASFQKAITDVLVAKSIRACNSIGMKKLAIAGGVSCNSALRSELKTACDENGIGLFMPAPLYCTDNAAMIAVCGYYEFIKGTRHGLGLNAFPSLEINAG
jgi:N6-L-threonylcarbamoyladenine synthase